MKDSEIKTFIWVKAKCHNSQFCNNAKYIGTYIDIPYSSKDFNSLKIMQKKAICQVCLLNKGIITDFDTIVLDRRPEMDDQPDKYYELVKFDNSVTPDSPAEKIAAALVAKNEFKKALDFIKREDLRESDSEIKAITEILVSTDFHDKYKEESREARYHVDRYWYSELRSYVNSLLGMNRDDSFYVECMLKVCIAYFDDSYRGFDSLANRSIKLWKESSESWDNVISKIEKLTIKYIDAYKQSLLSDKEPEDKQIELVLDVIHSGKEQSPRIKDFLNNAYIAILDDYLDKTLKGKSYWGTKLLHCYTADICDSKLDKIHDTFRELLTKCENKLADNEQLTGDEVNLLRLGSTLFHNEKERIDVLISNDCEYDGQ